MKSITIRYAHKLNNPKSKFTCTISNVNVHDPIGSARTFFSFSVRICFVVLILSFLFIVQ
jgi:ribosome-binding factor A